MKRNPRINYHLMSYNKYTNEDLKDIVVAVQELLKFRVEIVKMIKEGKITKKDIYNRKGAPPKWLQIKRKKEKKK